MASVLLQQHETAKSVLHGEAVRLPPDLPDTIAGCIGARLAEKPDGTVSSVDAATYRDITYAEAWDRAGRIAAGLAAQVAADRPVVCIQTDFLDALIAFWGCLRAGRTALPFTSVAQALARADSADDPLRDLGAPVLLIDAPTAAADRLCRQHPDLPVLLLDAVETHKISRSPPSRPAYGKRPACIMPTSGSTGRVKLVKLSNDALRYRYFCANHYRGLNPDCHRLGLFPFDSITGLRSAFLDCGSWVQLAGRVAAGDPLRVLSCLAQFERTAVQTTNALAARIIDAAERTDFRVDLSRLRAFGFGGEAITLPVVRRLDALLRRCGADCAIRGGYGATETGPILIGADPTIGSETDEHTPLGGCAAGISLRIVDDAGETLPQGVAGNIEVKGPQMMFSGYVDGSHLESFTADGWWRSGDLGEVRNNSFVFRGRRKDVIVVEGVKLSLVDIDLFLRVSFGCAAYAAILREAEDATDRLGIGLVRSGDAEPSDEAIRTAILRRFGLSATIIAPLDDDVPLTPTGKIDRSRLGARLLAYKNAARLVLSGGSNDVEEKVAAVWRTALGFETAPTIDFFTAGADSFAVVRLQLAWEEAFGTPLPPAALRGAATQMTMAALATGTSPSAVLSDRLETFKQRQLQFLANWNGSRPTRSGLVVGRSPLPALTISRWPRLGALLPKRRANLVNPTFWLLQHGNELSMLQEGLPTGTPVYGLGSGKHILDHRDPAAVKEVVASYVEEIREIQPRGPYWIGGACLGAQLAVPLARSLQDSGESVALLTLIDVDVSNLFKTSYDERVALIIGCKSSANPRRRFAEPSRGWRRWAPKGFLLRLLDTDYAQVFKPEIAKELCAAISDAMVWSHAEANDDVTASPPAGIKTFEAAYEMPPPFSMQRGRIHHVTVTVENQGTSTWPRAAFSGLMLANHWLDSAGGLIVWHDARAEIAEDVAPGGRVTVTLEIAAPGRSGDYLLEVDLVEQGIAWFKDHGTPSGYTEVHVS